MNHDGRSSRQSSRCTVTPTAPPLHLCDEGSSYKYHNGAVLAEYSAHHEGQIPSKHVTPPPDAVDDEPEPSAPPLELMDKVRGYESASFEAGKLFSSRLLSFSACYFHMRQLVSERSETLFR
ncbi:hypothetical protein TNIN_178651 [Trichonephila inaurata madagascariensis]|uniref:Uncharacterized protein n=1 Tax=Trichonephila inaurata madagascariensis TaxID=2747483 RepID=A0A8X6IIG9_9ARAC|nr:hypothetical protein TNIN_178651 [Trichonephila inaurata madagascariensis]